MITRECGVRRRRAGLEHAADGDQRRQGRVPRPPRAMVEVNAIVALD